MKPWMRPACWMVTTALIAGVVPWLTAASAYYQYIVEIIMVYVLAATGLNIAIGLAGQYQMAQGAIMAVAAYGLAFLHIDHGWPLWSAMPAALAMSLILGAIVAFFSARLGSHYFLLATFGVQVIIIGLIRELSALTGGVNGRPAVMSIDLFGTSYPGSTPAYSALLIVVGGIGLLLADLVSRSYLGLVMHGVRQNERLSSASGVFPNRYKFLAVLLGAAYAGVAGLVVGPIHTYLVPDSFGIEIALLLLIMVVVGGPGRIIGVAVAAVLLAIASQIAQSATTAWPLIYGLFVMVALTFTGKGRGRWQSLLDGLALFGQRQAPDTPTPEFSFSETILKEPARIERDLSAAPLALEIKDIRRSFGGVLALNGVWIEVRSGSVHGLVGPNGSGKTTLFETISGFVIPYDGSILSQGREVVGLKPAERARLGIGRTFQHPTVLPQCTVFENVVLALLPTIPVAERLSARSRPSTEIAERAYGALALVGLRDKAQKEAGLFLTASASFSTSPASSQRVLPSSFLMNLSPAWTRSVPNMFAR